MNRLVSTGLATVAGFFVARFADQLLGLDDLARDLADWWRSNLPSLTYTSGVPS